SSPSQKQIDKQRHDERIITRIKEISNSNHSLFGTMTMYYTLRNEGYGCGHNRVYRLMCINDIKSTYRRKPKYNYVKTNAEHTAENILNRDFNTTGPNQKWCTDVTEIKVPATGEKLFISPMIDLYDRYPVALEISDKNDAYLADLTLVNAHSAYPKAMPLVHSDRGFAYTRQVYKAKLAEYSMSQSMSRVSKCIDNGVCEGFQGQFKDMLFVLYPNISSKNEMIKAIKGTLDYYINHYPQKRLKGKSCGQVRKESLKQNEFSQYPIVPAKKYVRYWNEIEAKKIRQNKL
ncbi:MAG: IS3 family transposase, partial [Erysipelotrichaceae bacterium]|nr:IS3 family transposase [Erysipelotrichaceae bacterium]